VRFSLGGEFKRKDMYIMSNFYATTTTMWYDRAWGWLGLFDNKIKINAGKIDKEWNSGGQADEGVGKNSLFMVEFLPVEGLNFGFALNDPGRERYHNETLDLNSKAANRYLGADDWFKNSIVGLKYDKNNLYAAVGARFQYGGNYKSNNAKGMDIIAGLKLSRPGPDDKLTWAIDAGLRNIGQADVTWNKTDTGTPVDGSYSPFLAEIGERFEYTRGKMWYKIYVDVWIQEGKSAGQTTSQRYIDTEIGAEAKMTIVPKKVKAGLWLAGMIQDTGELRGNGTRRGWWIYTLDRHVSNTRLAARNPNSVDYAFFAAKPYLEWNPTDKLTIYVYDKVYVGQDMYTRDYAGYNNWGSDWTDALTANNRFGVDFRFSL
jgi:hypothetical protein